MENKDLGIKDLSKLEYAAIRIMAAMYVHDDVIEGDTAHTNLAKVAVDAAKKLFDVLDADSN